MSVLKRGDGALVEWRRQMLREGVDVARRIACVFADEMSAIQACYEKYEKPYNLAQKLGIGVALDREEDNMGIYIGLNGVLSLCLTIGEKGVISTGQYPVARHWPVEDWWDIQYQPLYEAYLALYQKRKGPTSETLKILAPITIRTMGRYIIWVFVGGTPFRYSVSKSEALQFKVFCDLIERSRDAYLDESRELGEPSPPP